LERIRKEMGEEFANGQRFATQEMGPKVTYKKLESFFYKVVSDASINASQEAAIQGIDPEFLSIDYEGAAIPIIKDYFLEIPRDATNKFCKGVFSVLNDLWQKLQQT
jgi:hypothetical protein